jgi:hypothetical protein
MVQEQVEVFTGGGKSIQYQLNEFLTQHAGYIDVIGFQVVDNRSPGSYSTDGNHVFYLLYKTRPTTTTTTTTGSSGSNIDIQ